MENASSSPVDFDPPSYEPRVALQHVLAELAAIEEATRRARIIIERALATVNDPAGEV